MKRNLVLGSLALMLAACGTGLIPAIPIDNALNIRGEKTTIALNAAKAQATGSINVTATFADNSDLYLPAIPSKFSVILDIQNIEFGAGCPASVPSRIEVSIPSVTATVQDASGSQTATATDVKFKIIKNGNAFMVDNISNGTLSFGDVAKLINILKSGGSNTGILKASVNTTSTPDLGNCAMTITWGNVKGSVQF